MKDKCRIRVLQLLKEHPMLPGKRIALVLDEFTEREVDATLIELSFEGLVKIDYEPVIRITAEGKDA